MSLRPPREDDMPAIVAMRSRFAPEPFSEERLRREWSEPGFDRDRDARVADGGYVAVEEDLDGRTWIELHGERPRLLLEWALGRATGSRIFCGGWEGGEPVLRAVEAAGFRLIRHSYRMAIDLDGVPAAPLLPPGVELRAFRSGEERAVYETHMETFEDSWEHVRTPYERWLHWTLERPGFDPGLWLLAVEGERIAGIVLCRIHEGDSTTGWVTILGVRRAWRRRGLGEALLRAGFAELARRGCRRAVLGVDAESLTGAHRLYERAGMHVVARFDIYERRDHAAAAFMELPHPQASVIEDDARGAEPLVASDLADRPNVLGCCSQVAARKRIAGLGFIGLVASPASEPRLARLAAALGL